MADKNTVQWWSYLIGKVKEADLSPENKIKLEQERAVRSAQKIVGEVPIKEQWEDLMVEDSNE